MLLEHEEAYQVVRSTQVGLMQHDGFSWQVKGERFEHLTELAEGGKIMDQAEGPLCEMEIYVRLCVSR